MARRSRQVATSWRSPADDVPTAPPVDKFRSASARFVAPGRVPGAGRRRYTEPRGRRVRRPAPRRRLGPLDVHRPAPRPALLALAWRARPRHRDGNRPEALAAIFAPAWPGRSLPMSGVRPGVAGLHGRAGRGLGGAHPGGSHPLRRRRRALQRAAGLRVDVVGEDGWADFLVGCRRPRRASTARRRRARPPLVISAPGRPAPPRGCSTPTGRRPSRCGCRPRSSGGTRARGSGRRCRSSGGASTRPFARAAADWWGRRPELAL